MSEELLLDLKNTGVCYRRRRLFGNDECYWALDDVSLQLYKGETLGIIGRNGAGKTTLLKLLADIIRPDRGELVRRPASYVILSLRLGFLEQLSARDNIIMSGMLFGMGRDEIEARIPEIMEFAELEDYADAPVATYSMGMSARLGFAIAMSADPDVMLIDEMLAVGDSGFREKSAAVLRERMLSNRTVVLVAHNEPAIRNLCSRVVWIENGRTVEQGEPETVVTNYREHLRKLTADKGATS
ncbi:hypothetical protein PHACT_12035 [Pseudohongiella acticola]|uniref:ABC transporter domain-containing protein n=1 Tax=Pseudohongiella acticola TaxID=1524254 RepID=A0A1E8CMY4_9GAMM|nr:ATP-binding cassette domain-containing protein [Pseudohongiella acticola]OFE13774.1 hypothetical protein PHACT_12035 [Pseudohongiella acticola]